MLVAVVPPFTSPTAPICTVKYPLVTGVVGWSSSKRRVPPETAS